MLVYPWNTFNPLNASVALILKSVNLLRKAVDWFLYEGNTGV